MKHEILILEIVLELTFLAPCRKDVVPISKVLATRSFCHNSRFKVVSILYFQVHKRFVKIYCLLQWLPTACWLLQALTGYGGTDFWKSTPTRWTSENPGLFKCFLCPLSIHFLSIISDFNCFWCVYITSFFSFLYFFDLDDIHKQKHNVKICLMEIMSHCRL